MQHYVTYDDSNGTLTGAYYQEIRADHQECNIVVSAEEHRQWTTFKANAARDGLEPLGEVESVVEVPESITPRQGMLILSRYSLLTPVQSALASMEGQEGVEARIDFERANEWKRSWPLLVGMATQFGLSSAQIDQMFIEAAAL